MSREDISLIVSGGKVLVIQPQAAALRRLNDLLQEHDIVGVNLFMDEADTMCSNRAGPKIANPGLNERERFLYKLMGPLANHGGKQHIPLLNSRIRTIVAVSSFRHLKVAMPATASSLRCTNVIGITG